MTTCSTAQIDSTPAALGGGGEVRQHLRERERPGVGVHQSEFHATVLLRPDAGRKGRRPIATAPRGCYGPAMDLVELAPSVYACLQEERGLGTQQLRPRRPRRRSRRRHLLGPAAHARPDRDVRARRGRARRVGSSTRIATATIAGATSSSRRPRSSAIACAPSSSGVESPQMMQALRGATGSSDPATAHIRRRARRLGLHRHRAAAADDAGRRSARARPRRRRRSISSGSARRTPPATSSSTCRASASSSPATCSSVSARRSAGRARSAQWIRALDAIVALDPAVVVPGHGPLCGVEGPREMKAYLEYVSGEAARAFADGLPALEAAKRIDPGPYARWTRARAHAVHRRARLSRAARRAVERADRRRRRCSSGMYELREAQRRRATA